MVVSSATTPSVASSTSSTTWAMRMWRRAITTLSFSAMSRVLPLRRMPAVSTKMYSVPSCDHGLVHRIARGAGDRRDDGALLAGERVEQRRFAHVGPADDRDLDARRGRRFFHRRLAAREAFGHVVEHGVHADAVLRRYREDVGDAESVEFVGQAVAHLRVDLVDGQRDGLAEALEHLREVAVAAGDFGAPVHQEDDVGGALEGEFGLVQDLRGDVLLVVHDDAAGVDQLEAPAVVFGSPMYAVARDAGFVPDDGAPLSCDAIEKGGLSYVGPAHDDHRGNGI